MGSFTGYPSYHGQDEKELEGDQDVFEKGLGLDRARKDRTYLAAPWLQNPEEPMVKLSALLKDASFVHTLAEADDSDLEEARNELRRFMTMMETLGRTSSRRFGPGAFGLVVIGAGQKFMRIDDYARQCLLWARMGTSPEMHQGMSSILDNTSVVENMERVSKGMDVLAKEVPAMETLTSPQRMRTAARSRQAQERYVRGRSRCI